MGVIFLTHFLDSNKSNKGQQNAMLAADMVKDVYTAIFAHEHLKHRLQAFAKDISLEEFTAEKVYHADSSELGKWIRSVGMDKFSKFRAFTRLIEHHKMFHYAAANVVSLAKAGRLKEANTMLNVQFEDFSDAIISDLLTIREAVEATQPA